jgi:hypothetical protein
MVRSNDEDEVPLMLAAQELEISYKRARRLVLVGILAGRQLAGRWLVKRSSIEQVRGRLLVDA